MKKAAYFSACGVFRYWLTRCWDPGLPRLAVIMLNPSTADAERDDPTIRKLVGFATRGGYGGFEVVNLFAYRATKPAELKRAGWPVGPENDACIDAAVGGCGATLCAWGSHAAGHPREARVREMIQFDNTVALRVNADGTPAHPLMLPYSCRFVEFKA